LAGKGVYKMIKVCCRAECINTESAGLTVKQVYESHSKVLDIASYATPLVNSKKANFDYVLKDGDKLEFILPVCRDFFVDNSNEPTVPKKNVTIKYRDDFKEDDLAGMTVREALTLFAPIFHIPLCVVPCVNKFQVSLDYVLKDEDILEFIRHPEGILFRG
jgi:molybdopterin converting factor small subunit